MKPLKQLTAFSLLLAALCGCEEPAITRQDPTIAPDLTVANFATIAPESTGKKGPSGLPSPTIVEQTYVPTNDLFAEYHCRAWRITWPTYPAGTNPNQIPTVFTVSNGALNSFNYLNSTSASTTYKTTFNLYHNNKLEEAGSLWSELIHTFNAGDNMGWTRFVKSKSSAASVETWVKGRPDLFKHYYEHESNTTPPYSEVANYEQGAIYLFQVGDYDETTLHQYGGIRIVSMSPRIIEVYLAVPAN